MNRITVNSYYPKSIVGEEIGIYSGSIVRGNVIGKKIEIVCSDKPIIVYGDIGGEEISIKGCSNSISIAISGCIEGHSISIENTVISKSIIGHEISIKNSFVGVSLYSTSSMYVENSCIGTLYSDGKTTISRLLATSTPIVVSRNGVTGIDNAKIVIINPNVLRETISELLKAVENGEPKTLDTVQLKEILDEIDLATLPQGITTIISYRALHI